jgi:dTDP-4-dehydrorhamnose reductase
VLAPVDARDVATGLLNLIDQGAVGLFNIAGPALTRLELLQVFLGQWRKVFDGPMPDVAPCLLRDVFDHPRPLNTSLDVTKLKAVVDFRPRSMEAVCEELVSQAASCL